MHICVDATFGAVHTVKTTVANALDVTQTVRLLHGQETIVHVHGDAGYRGASKCKELKDKDFDWEIAARPGKRRQMNGIDQKIDQMEHTSNR